MRLRARVCARPHTRVPTLTDIFTDTYGYVYIYVHYIFCIHISTRAIASAHTHTCTHIQKNIPHPEAVCRSELPPPAFTTEACRDSLRSWPNMQSLPVPSDEASRCAINSCAQKALHQSSLAKSPDCPAAHWLKARSSNKLAPLRNRESTKHQRAVDLQLGMSVATQMKYTNACVHFAVLFPSCLGHGVWAGHGKHNSTQDHAVEGIEYSPSCPVTTAHASAKPA